MSTTLSSTHRRLHGHGHPTSPSCKATTGELQVRTSQSSVHDLDALQIGLKDLTIKSLDTWPQPKIEPESAPPEAALTTTTTTAPAPAPVSGGAQWVRRTPLGVFAFQGSLLHHPIGAYQTELAAMQTWHRHLCTVAGSVPASDPPTFVLSADKRRQPLDATRQDQAFLFGKAAKGQVIGRMGWGNVLPLTEAQATALRGMEAHRSALMPTPSGEVPLYVVPVRTSASAAWPLTSLLHHSDQPLLLVGPTGLLTAAQDMDGTTEPIPLTVDLGVPVLLQWIGCPVETLRTLPRNAQLATLQVVYMHHYRRLPLDAFLERCASVMHEVALEWTPPVSRASDAAEATFFQNPDVHMEYNGTYKTLPGTYAHYTPNKNVSTPKPTPTVPRW